MDNVCPLEGLERLLLATDGSKFSEGAIREALSLAKQCASRLTAISVVQTNLEFEAAIPQMDEKWEDEALKHLESIKEKASREGIACKIMAVRGEEPHQEIVHAAEQNQVNMIIVGRHGRTGLLRLLMGSVTAKVIGHTPCSVLVVPPDAKIECRNILIATDGSRYSGAAAREAIGIAKKCGSSLVVLSVASSETELRSARDNVQKVIDAGKIEGVLIEAVTLIGRPYEVIVNTSRQKRADLIIVGSHGRTGLERLLIGSVAERVIGHSETAVLIAKVKMHDAW
ncbi:MAG TPA: universal stress protein [Nitrospirota bacterium]|nr:universal stress protein [Nitrospirota bacterium]